MVYTKEASSRMPVPGWLSIDRSERQRPGDTSPAARDSEDASSTRRGAACGSFSGASLSRSIPMASSSRLRPTRPRQSAGKPASSKQRAMTGPARAPALVTIRCRASALPSSCSSLMKSMMYAISTGPVLSATPTAMRDRMSEDTEDEQDIRPLHTACPVRPMIMTRLRPTRSERLPRAGEQNICAKLYADPSNEMVKAVAPSSIM
mmetsp:Transcript_72785/g.229969  ORF Transcript_72785/g.229969 Transcript_72785/m.229969 type:complete len:206 (-) Transcript_72785:165-782(-)